MSSRERSCGEIPPVEAKKRGGIEQISEKKFQGELTVHAQDLASDGGGQRHVGKHLVEHVEQSLRLGAGFHGGSSGVVLFSFRRVAEPQAHFLMESVDTEKCG